MPKYGSQLKYAKHDKSVVLVLLKSQRIHCLKFVQQYVNSNIYCINTPARAATNNANSARVMCTCHVSNLPVHLLLKL